MAEKTNPAGAELVKGEEALSLEQKVKEDRERRLRECNERLQEICARYRVEIRAKPDFDSEGRVVAVPFLFAKV